MGLERVLLALEEEGLDAARGARARRVRGRGRRRRPRTAPASSSRELRAAGVAADAPYEDRPLKAQLKMADRAGAGYAAIVGERELEAGAR